MPSGKSGSRPRLTRERVLGAAMQVADADGVTSLTMRSLAGALDVKPMSLYHYVASKEELLDAMVDHVFAEIVIPPDDGDWRVTMRARCDSARAAMKRHPWAIPLLESRAHPGPATLGHHDAVLGLLHRAGFSWEMAGHAFALIDAYLYGFVLQEVSLPFDGPEHVPELASAIMASFPAEQFPSLAAFTEQHVLQPGYDYAAEFEFGLSLILNGLEP